MQDNLRQTLHQMSVSAGELSGAADHLQQITEDASRTLHTQNAELEQAATAVDEVARNAVPPKPRKPVIAPPAPGNCR
ncbi:MULTISPECIES: hypothetical protein [Pseudomonas]|uniref:hypothetical protein n=1 Tax=Pseudomonas TaxID=286 RepID=UPI00257C195E|nr:MULTISPECIES: hypothetical protein [Pseudomonas]